jgi:hypothetical protein
MKTFAIAACVMLFAATASAAEFSVSQSTLDSMGLGEMRPMTDHDGLAVRGKGAFEDMFGYTIPGWFNDTLVHFGEQAGSRFSPQTLGDPMISSVQSLISSFDFSSLPGSMPISF